MKKKILLYVKNDPFKDSRVNKITRTLLNNNYQVDLIGVNRSQDKPPSKFLGRANYYPVYVSKAGSLLGKIFEICFFVFATSIRSIILTIFNKYSIVYINSPPEFLIIPALLVKILSFNRVKIVSDLHDLGPEFYQSRFSNRGLIYRMICWSEYLLVRFSDSIIVTNQSYRETILERYGFVEKDNVYIVKNYPNISDYNIFRKAKSKVKKQDKNVLLYLGSINPQDGIIGAIDSVKSIVNDRERKDVECWIVGEGEDLERAKDMVESLGLADNFRFWGGIWDRNRLAEIVKSADICLEPAPSNPLNSKSTFIKIFEYMLAGKPIVSYDLKETRVSAKDASIYVDPKEEGDFSKAILKLLNSNNLAKRLEKNSTKLSSGYIWEYGPEKRLLESLESIGGYRSSVLGRDILIRILDILISSVLLTVLLPLLLLIALIIKISSKGPAIFKQRRVGFKERDFYIYKFRTMVDGASEEDVEIDPKNPNIQIEDDPRVTKVGRFLRKYSLDELPQLINVIKGEMSLVGPRPLVRKEVDYFSDRWKARFRVKPGLTGLAQISGRNNLDVKKAIRLDLKMINNFSFSKYISILIRTVMEVFYGRGT